MSNTASRISDYAISPVILNRWSGRSFADKHISEQQLLTILEAARWAPSSSNRQPWRLLYARRNSAHWDNFILPLNEQNRLWASKAAAIIYILSQHTYLRDGQTVPSASHAFDAGAAWQNLAIQAGIDSFNTRAMAGFNQDKARSLLHVPADFTLHAAIAIGRRGTLEDLHENFHAKEAPSDRLPLEEIILEGGFNPAEILF